jgi:Holliday junction DNA helicase RuvA
VIGSLRGRLVDRGTSEVLVEVAGVGYRVTIAPTTALALGEPGDEVFVWIHHHLREDAETLYGFAGRAERVTFEALIGAHGVGPALALAILSVHAPAALTRILLDDDVAALCLVPGVGKKTAARLLVELKSRLDIPDADLASAVAAGQAASTNGGGGAAGAAGSGPASARADVRAALAGLGYSGDEIREATVDLPDDGDAAELLRAALSRLATGR